MIALEDLKKMAQVGGPCLSIFQPLREDFSQFTKADKGLLAAAHLADGLLEQRGYEEGARKRFLRPIARIADNTNWPGRTGGVVIFRAPGFTRASFWPTVWEPQVKLADHFFILPLLEGFGERTNFWVLALNTKRVRLLRGTAQRLIEVELHSGVPLSLEEAGAFNPLDHDLENRSSCGPSVGQMKGVRSGTSTFRETRGQYIHDFFKAIDRAIQPILAKSGDPLIIAAVPREVAAYRQINSYEHLLDEAIHGSPDAIPEETLHRRALQLVCAQSSLRAGQAKQQMAAAMDHGLLITDFEEIAREALHGRVDHLYVGSRLTPGEDQVNQTALDVIRHSGKVVYVASLETPGGVAAILRYRAEPALAHARPRIAVSE
jgi:hypothetical protein